MVTDEQIKRINELAAKAKTPEGLTNEEKAEQQTLRKLYIQSIRAGVKDQLDRIRFVDEDPENARKN